MEREEQVVVSGRRLGYYHVGGLPLLIIHGFGTAWERDDPFFKFLARHLELFVIDLPGYAESEPLDGAQTLAFYADTLEEFCATKGLERVFILGLSFGSLVATAFAASYPKRCQKLTLVGAPIFLPKMWRGILKLCVRIPFSLARYRLVRIALYNLVYGLTRLPPIEAAYLLRRVAAEDYLEGRYARLHVLRANLRIVAEEDLNQLIAKVKVPYLLVYGSNDVLLTQGARQMFPEHLVVIEDAPHCPHWTHPEQLAEAVIQFLLSG